jgi:hypothetical protein
MNNEPVAWMDYLEHSDVYDLNVSGRGIPLYTHPAKELDEQFKKGFEAGKEEGWKAHKFHHPVKTLTDEEILDALKDALNGWKYIRESHGDLYGVGWDRVQDKLEAILRKAQEK